MSDYESMTDAELRQVAEDVRAERDRRALLSTIPEQVNGLLGQMLDAEGVTEGSEWKQTTLGYPVGREVTYPLPDSEEVGTWVNRQPGNRYAPGSPGGGWSLQPPDENTPALWVRPAWAELGYDTGDEVTFPTYADGAVYRSLIDQNTHSPAEYPDGWERLGGEPPAPDPDEVPVWVEPTWSAEEGGAYPYGAKVHYPTADDPVYVSTFDGWNTWPPDGEGAYGWSLDEGS